MKLFVIKIGGSTLGSQDTTYHDMVELQKRGFGLVVVHGGGKTITKWLAKQGAGTKFVNGQRVTDRATLDVVVAVLAGLVNKEIVAAINSAGGKAIGLSGIDAGFIIASKLNKDTGYTGKVESINVEVIKQIIESGYVAVIAPPCYYPGGSEGEPAFLNVNADSVAGVIARVLKAERLVFLTDVPGIYGENKTLIDELNESSARKLMKKGIITEGMIPKIEACLEGAKTVNLCRIIDGRQSNALLKDIDGSFPGTTVIGD